MHVTVHKGEYIMKASFKNAERPLLCTMIKVETIAEAISTIVNSEYDGAEAYGIQLEVLREDQRSEEQLKYMFSFCKGKPIYITSYRNYYNEGKSDDECMELLLRGIKCGATLADVMGDLYHPEPIEITYDEEAVKKQEELIKKIHDMGGEVLISSHFHRFISKEETMKIAREQERRGADVVKIVNYSSTEEQELIHFDIASKMKHELDPKTKYLYLANGPHSKLLREIGPFLGVCMWLCIEHYVPYDSKEQPKLRNMRDMRINMAL